MNIHWNKISSMSWPKVTCNMHMQNGPWVIDDARKYDVHIDPLWVFSLRVYIVLYKACISKLTNTMYMYMGTLAQAALNLNIEMVYSCKSLLYI